MRFKQQPGTALIFSSFAGLTDFGFVQGPAVPVPRLASLAASLTRTRTVVSAATSLPGARAREPGWRVSRRRWEPNALSLSFLASFGSGKPQTKRCREEEWQMDWLVADAQFLGVEGGQEWTHCCLPCFPSQRNSLPSPSAD